jgi:hypothetical protein
MTQNGRSDLDITASTTLAFCARFAGMSCQDSLRGPGRGLPRRLVPPADFGHPVVVASARRRFAWILRHSCRRPNLDTVGPLAIPRSTVAGFLFVSSLLARILAHLDDKDY